MVNSAGDSAAEVRALWGDALVPIPASLLGPNVSAGTRAFLTEVGLPRDNRLEFTFYRDERLLTPAVRGPRAYLVFGESGGYVPFAIEAGRDAVVTLHPDGPFMFVNSTIADFVYCCGVFGQRVDRLLHTPVPERAPQLDAIRRLFDARDPEALDPDGLLSAWEDILQPYGPPLAG